MSGLPTQIPPQDLPFVQKGPDGDTYVEVNWYLFLYNLSKSVFGTAGGGTPVSPSDALDMANLLAETADIPQAYRGLANLRALIGVTALLPDPTPAAQPVQAVTVGASPFNYTALSNGVLSVTAGTVSAVSIIRQGVSVATGITSSTSGAIKSLTDEKGSGGTFGFAAGVDFVAGTTTSLTLSQAYGSASDLWVAFDAGEQGPDSYSLSGTILTFTSAIPVGTSKVFVKGALPSTISASGGLIPVRRLDQVQITYSSAPTVAFIPQ